MKYRIIEEVNGNDERFFTVEFYKRGIFGYRWKPFQRYSNSGDFVYTKQFESREDAMKVVNAYKVTRTVVDEGEI